MSCFKRTEQTTHTLEKIFERPHDELEQGFPAHLMKHRVNSQTSFLQLSLAGGRIPEEEWQLRGV